MEIIKQKNKDKISLSPVNKFERNSQRSKTTYGNIKSYQSIHVESMKRLIRNFNLESEKGKISEKNSEKLSMGEKQEIQNKLFKIFNNNSEFCDKSNQKIINLTAFRKLLDLSDLKRHKDVKMIKVDSLFNKIKLSSKKINFESFVDYITKIGIILYSDVYDLNIKKCLLTLIESNLINDDPKLKLEDSSSDSEDFGHKNFDNQLGVDISIIFHEIYFSLFEIYKKYFSHELDMKITNILELEKKSLNSILFFSKEFEITSLIGGLNKINSVLFKVKDFHSENKNSIIHNSLAEKGRSFKLTDFFLLILFLSRINFSKRFPHLINEDTEIIILFLEKLENSDGFKKFYFELISTKNLRISLIPKKFIEKNTNLHHKLGIKSENKKVDHSQNFQKILKMNDEQYQKFLTHSNSLKTIFNFYAESLVNSKEKLLGFQGFSHFIHDLGNIELKLLLGIDDISIIFSKAFSQKKNYY